MMLVEGEGAHVLLDAVGGKEIDGKYCKYVHLLLCGFGGYVGRRGKFHWDVLNNFLTTKYKP